jgi:hypothetical protein
MKTAEGHTKLYQYVSPSWLAPSFHVVIRNPGDYVGRHRRAALMPAGTLRCHGGRWFRGTEETPL